MFISQDGARMKPFQYEFIIQNEVVTQIVENCIWIAKPKTNMRRHSARLVFQLLLDIPRLPTLLSETDGVTSE